MFTGIVEEVGIAKSIRPGKLTISATEILQGTKLGDSLAVNGACLTVNALDSGSFSVDITPETLRRTNLGSLHPGSRVNLERALLVGGRLGGHLVQGHVDARLAIGRLANDLYVGFQVEDGLEALAHQGLVFDDQNADRFHSSLSCAGQVVQRR